MIERVKTNPAKAEVEIHQNRLFLRENYIIKLKKELKLLSLIHLVVYSKKLAKKVNAKLVSKKGYLTKVSSKLTKHFRLTKVRYPDLNLSINVGTEIISAIDFL
jgi:hypothetical protein